MLEGIIEGISDAIVDYQVHPPSARPHLAQRLFQISSRQETILLSGMDSATGAGHCSGDGEVCIKGTRVDVLQLNLWSKPPRVLSAWRRRTRKSAIARTFAEVGSAGGNICAVFFCSRDSEDWKNFVDLPDSCLSARPSAPPISRAAVPSLEDHP